MTEKISRSLRLIDLLAELPAEYTEQLSKFTMLRKVREGETIFCQGEPSPYCFGIVSGQVTIQRAPKEKGFTPKILSHLGPGSMFGEQALFKDSPRTASAVASKDGELVAIQGKQFRDWLEKDIEVGVPLLMGMLQGTMGRLRQTSHELSLVYGVGRLLASDKSISERIRDTADFLRASLEDVDEIVVYQRNPYWEEFEAGGGVTAPVMNLQNALVEQVIAVLRPIVSQAKDEVRGNAAVALVPFIDSDASQHPLQGFLWVASQKNPRAFSPAILLLLSTVSVQFTEALLRARRQEDLEAKNRLSQNKQSYSL